MTMRDAFMCMNSRMSLVLIWCFGGIIYTSVNVIARLICLLNPEALTDQTDEPDDQMWVTKVQLPLRAKLILKCEGQMKCKANERMSEEQQMTSRNMPSKTCPLKHGVPHSGHE